MATRRKIFTRQRTRVVLASTIALPALLAPLLLLAPAASALGGGDDDSDGIPNSVEGDVDTDGDGFPDRLDRNSDGDALPDAVELTEDRDNDGVPDYRDADRSETTATVTNGPDGSTITASGFGTDAPVSVMSDPGSVTIGSDLSDGTGRVSILVTIPSGATQVTVQGYGPDGGVHEAIAVLGAGPATPRTTVAGPEAPSTTSTTEAPSTTEPADAQDDDPDVDDELAMTGPSAVMIEAIAGSSMLSMGGGLTMLSKRLSRRSSAMPAISRHKPAGRNYTAPGVAWPPAEALSTVRAFFSTWLARSGDPPAQAALPVGNSAGIVTAIRSVWPRGPGRTSISQPFSAAGHSRSFFGSRPTEAFRFGCALA